MIEEQIKKQTRVLTEIKDILEKQYEGQGALKEYAKRILSFTETHQQQTQAFIEAKVVGIDPKDGGLVIKGIEAKPYDNNGETHKYLSVVTKGGSQYIRVRALDEDFLLGVKLAENGKEMKWEEAIDYCKERKRDLLTKRQYLIVAIFHDEINNMLESLGGDKLGYEWSVSEYIISFAWYYDGNSGTLRSYGKCNSSQVRPSLAHFSNL